MATIRKCIGNQKRTKKGEMDQPAIKLAQHFLGLKMRAGSGQGGK